MRLDQSLFRLDGRVAVVTGGGGAIGGAICTLFANVGAKVACLDIDVERARERVAAIVAAGGTGLALACDVASPEATRAAAGRIEAELGPPTVLVNCAATLDRSGTVVDVDVEEWERVHRIDLTGAFLMSRAVLPAMIAAGGGAIVHVASIAGHVGRPGRPAYASSKGALIQLGRAMAVDHAASGVRVNTVSPGAIDTHRVAYRFGAGDAAARRAQQAQYPLKRFGHPGEVAAAVLFLASDAASFVTGTDLLVDGGFCAT